MGIKKLSNSNKSNNEVREINEEIEIKKAKLGIDWLPQDFIVIERTVSPLSHGLAIEIKVDEDKVLDAIMTRKNEITKYEEVLKKAKNFNFLYGKRTKDGQSPN
jgi:hypothetical protein